MPILMFSWGVFSLECMDWDGGTGLGPIAFTPDATSRQNFPTSPVRPDSQWLSGFAIVVVMQSVEDGLIGHGALRFGFGQPGASGLQCLV